MNTTLSDSDAHALAERILDDEAVQHLSRRQRCAATGTFHRVIRENVYTPHTRRMIQAMLAYRSGRTLQSVGDEWGISRERARQWVVRASAVIIDTLTEAFNLAIDRGRPRTAIAIFSVLDRCNGKVVGPQRELLATLRLRSVHLLPLLESENASTREYAQVLLGQTRSRP